MIYIHIYVHTYIYIYTYISLKFLDKLLTETFSPHDIYILGILTHDLIQKIKTRNFFFWKH